MGAPTLDEKGVIAACSNCGQKVRTSALPDVAARFRIQSIPTMALFTGGREVARTVGARPATGIEAFIAHAVGDAAGIGGRGEPADP
jgi:thioredoxin 2